MFSVLTLLFIQSLRVGPHFFDDAAMDGLHIEKHATYGWTITTLTEETAAWLAEQPGIENKRRTLLQVTIMGGGDEDGEGATTTTTLKGGRQTSKNQSIKDSVMEKFKAKHYSV